MPKFIKIILWSILGVPLLYIGILTIKYPSPNCENQNPIFEQYTYDSKEYRMELIRLLKQSKIDETDFWFDEYVDSTHISITIQNQNICAKGLVTVHKLEGDGTFINNLMAAKGKSYGGALVGVKLDLTEDALHPEIILASVDDIID